MGKPQLSGDILVLVNKISSTVERIDLFDLLRGYFVLVLVIDHLERWPGIFDWISGQGRLWASAAEGFFIVSGIMIGLIRGRKAVDKPLWDVTKQLWSRGFQLYVWAVGISLFFSLWGLLWPYGGHIAPGLDQLQGPDTPANFLLRTFILEFSYGWSGFLKFYAVYIALAPIAIWLLRKNLWWLLLAVCSSVWLYGLDKDNWWYSWQLLFYGGTVVGFYVPEIQAWWRALPRLGRTILSSAVLTVSLGVLMLSVFFTHGWNVVKADWSPMSFDQYLAARSWIDPLFDRVSLQPLRVITAALWFSALVLLFLKFQPFIKKWLGWLLMTYGQNSLYVYILHGFFVYALDLLLPRHAIIPLNALLIASVVLILWYLTKKQFLFRYIPR